MNPQVVTGISVIIPTRNEEKNIFPLVERIHDSLSTAQIPYEVIFVDDNSEDKTQQMIQLTTRSYPVQLFIKQGKKGKAFSLYEGFAKVKYPVIAMLDGDLQYPPEAIPQMIEKLTRYDVVVANRKHYEDSKLRRTLNKGFRYMFGKVLFGFSHDVQSGLKVFNKRVLETIQFTPRSGWTFDLEFLHRAREAGFIITNHDITFEKRQNGESKVGFLKTSVEIGSNALRVRTKKINPQHFAGKYKMIDAGVGYKKRQYITHTTLPHTVSALITFTSIQKFILFLLLIAIGSGFYTNWLLSLQVFIAGLSLIYFLDTIFNLYLVLKSIHSPQEIVIDDKEIAELEEDTLPMYTILCPLYKEAHIIPSFLSAIDNLSWPKKKLDVILLLEADDRESIETAKRLNLPPFVRVLVVPDSQPKTKPKACNYGLSHAKGEYLVIYDAEDIPDPMQLKKAYLAFKKSPANIACLQAKLNYFNPHQNLLTRFFTAEYSLWFDITLTGLQAVDTNIPLGGTSNHFRTQQLLELQGWDPFNVTEDADLGMRLFKKGFKTAVIDSTTLEEANSRVGNWFRQRSRWIKGYMQTYLVHTRDLFKLHKNHGMHAWYFHLIIGGKIAFILINPLLWITTIAYFVLNAYVGSTIEALYPSYVFYMAAFSLIAGNFLFLYYYMIGCLKRGQWELIKYTFLLPIYWLMISIAGMVALYQLILKPHYWEKTVHGLHIKKIPLVTKKAIVTPDVAPITVIASPKQGLFTKAKSIYLTGSLLILSAVISNGLNFIFSSYLGRTIDLQYFTIVSLVGSFLYLINIPVNALSSTTKYRSGFLAGRYGAAASYEFWKKNRFKTFLVGFSIAVIWSALSYQMSNFFHTNTILPFLSFAPYIIASFVNATDTGYLSGKLVFGALAVVTVSEAAFKLLIAYSLIQAHLPQYAYLAIPFSTVASFFLGWVCVKIYKDTSAHAATKAEVAYMPKRFFFAAGLSGLSTMTYLSLDVILATHFLSKTEAGIYALLALSGKMIFFLGNLASQFIPPLVSRHEGANTNATKTFRLILLSTSALAIVGFVLFGVMAPLSLPLLFGKRAEAILPYAMFYSLAMLFFTVSRVYNSYYLIKKVYTFPILGFLLGMLQLALVYLNHDSVVSIVFSMYIIGCLNLFLSILLHINIAFVQSLERLAKDFVALFSTRDTANGQTNKLRVLIFNWRDNKHVWAGGAEVYVQEIAKRFVKDGNSVTIFCGNDGQSIQTETIDGVHIIRRGGTYLVYAWAFLYYILKFRGKYDVIIDCENGIPFFTPLYTRVVVFLLVHHVHQEVFRNHLRFPLSSIAKFFEGTLMPIVYSKKSVITVSESSKQALAKLGIAKPSEIHIVHNGINHEKYTVSDKTPYPLFTYLGRLKPYKNIDVAIKAFHSVSQQFPDARLAIVGDGESRGKMGKLVEQLQLQPKVTFYGKVSESKKALLLAKSWAVLQPSMTEGWGITVIEANACGTPVIASNVSGLKDSVVHGRTGMLVTLGSISEFVSAMITMVTDEKIRLELSRNAYIWSQNFTWDSSAQKFYQTIVQAVKEKQQVRSVQKLVLVNK